MSEQEVVEAVEAVGVRFGDAMANALNEVDELKARAEKLQAELAVAHGVIADLRARMFGVSLLLRP